jgi:hypothetical protein
MTAWTLTRSQVGLFKINVADDFELTEPQAASESNTESHARDRTTFHSPEPDEIRSLGRLESFLPPGKRNRLLAARISAKTAGQHGAQNVVAANKMMEQRRGRMQTNNRKQHISHDVVDGDDLLGEDLVGTDNRRQLAQ